MHTWMRRNRLALTGLGVALATAALAVTWLRVAHAFNRDLGHLAVITGLTLLSLVMAGRCSYFALADVRRTTGRCRACGARFADAREHCPVCGRMV